MALHLIYPQTPPAFQATPSLREEIFIYFPKGDPLRGGAIYPLRGSAIHSSPELKCTQKVGHKT